MRDQPIEDYELGSLKKKFYIKSSFSYLVVVFKLSWNEQKTNKLLNNHTCIMFEVNKTVVEKTGKYNNMQLCFFSPETQKV